MKTLNLASWHSLAICYRSSKIICDNTTGNISEILWYNDSQECIGTPEIVYNPDFIDIDGYSCSGSSHDCQLAQYRIKDDCQNYGIIQYTLVANGCIDKNGTDDRL